MDGYNHLLEEALVNHFKREKKTQRSLLRSLQSISWEPDLHYQVIIAALQNTYKFYSPDDITREHFIASI